jgi:CBS domain-containing protein/uncharacterized protein (DUF2267 family)
VLRTHRKGTCLAFHPAMSLSKYIQTRLVVQRPDTCAYDAIRAMEDNHVGAVIVHDGKAVVGVVTDRDLAIQIIANELDPFETALGDLVAGPVAVLPVEASESDAAALMRDRHVRRIPIVDGPELVGLVTLDDLLLEQGVDSATLAEIVRAQLAEPSRLKPKGETHPTRHKSDVATRRERLGRRHEGRATRSYEDLITRTLAITGLGTRERAEAALDEVLGGILRRITPDEANQLLAQLPSLLSCRVSGAARGPDRSVTRTTVEQGLVRRLDVSPQEAGALVFAVCEAFGATVSSGEIEDVRSQLPGEMRNMLATVWTI